MTDQQRGATVLPGHRYKAQTPRLDAFRQESVTFSNAHCPSPHCCPSRATFFTGLYPSQHGVWNNVNVPNALSRGLKPGVTPWSQDFAAAGYTMLFAGKWHVSNYQSPDQFGWTELANTDRYAKGLMSGSADEQDKLTLQIEKQKMSQNAINDLPPARNPGEIQRPGLPPYTHYGSDEDPFRDRSVVATADEALRAHADHPNPWFLYCGTLGPHDPYRVPQRFLDLYDPAEIELPESFPDPMADKPTLYRKTRDRFDQLPEAEQREALRHYLAFCTYEDHLFGQLLDTLKETGQYEDTVIIYLSDHGDYMGEHGLWAKGLPAFESAYHIPLIARLPDSFTPRRDTIIDAFVSLADLGPTLCDLAGIESQTDFAGSSLLPWMQGTSPSVWRDAVFTQSNGNETYGIQRTVRTDRWKLVYNGFDYDELYDLAADPHEMTNLLHPAQQATPRRTGRPPLSEVPEDLKTTVRELYEKLWRFNFDHGDNLTTNYIMTALMSYGSGLALKSDN